MSASCLPKTTIFNANLVSNTLYYFGYPIKMETLILAVRNRQLRSIKLTQNYQSLDTSGQR
jgi:hypothetical protein